MVQKFSSLFLVLGLGIVLASFVAGPAFAEKGGIKGSPDKTITSIDQLPNGIRNKLDENGNYRAGQRAFNPNSRWGKVIAELQDCQGADCEKEFGGEAVESTNEAIQIVCPTSLDDEAMRLCLGIPAPKKAVRVKKLNVQLGGAE